MSDTLRPMDSGVPPGGADAAAAAAATATATATSNNSCHVNQLAHAADRLSLRSEHNSNSTAPQASAEPPANGHVPSQPPSQPPSSVSPASDPTTAAAPAPAPAPASHDPASSNAGPKLGYPAAARPQPRPTGSVVSGVPAGPVVASGIRLPPGAAPGRNMPGAPAAAIPGVSGARPGMPRPGMSGNGSSGTRLPGATPIPPSLRAKLEQQAKGNRAPPPSLPPDPTQTLDKIRPDRPAPPRPGMPAALPGATIGGVGAGARPGFPVRRVGPPGAGAAGPPTGGLAGRRRGPPLRLGALGGGPTPGPPAPGGRRLAPPGPLAAASTGGLMSNAFDQYRNIVDTEGRLRFADKAILHARGVEFGNGTTFHIKLDDFELLNELGRGNYGTVRKVRHTQTKVLMAMKEIRLELDDPKLKAIIMELDILHRAVAPQIVEFYGAFFVEGCVYYCMEFMDAGSLDKLCIPGRHVPEPVLARIAWSMVSGLRFLKDSLNIIHRDVKPTNVLVNIKGEVKLCDFGVSGELEKSLAKTNIGCQSYMAPERIDPQQQQATLPGAGPAGTYTVAADVWSLGLSLVEIAKGGYPYPPETYSDVFAQLQAIVWGDPPTLPAASEDGSGGYSAQAHDFVRKCLAKNPTLRASFAELLEHPFLVADRERAASDDDVDMAAWIQGTLEAKKALKDAKDAHPNSPTISREPLP